MSELQIGDYVNYSGKLFQVFNISDYGVVTVQNILPNQVPASLVLTPNQVVKCYPLVKIIKN